MQHFRPDGRGNNPPPNYHSGPSHNFWGYNNNYNMMGQYHLPTVPNGVNMHPRPLLQSPFHDQNIGYVHANPPQYMGMYYTNHMNPVNPVRIHYPGTFPMLYQQQPHPANYNTSNNFDYSHTPPFVSDNKNIFHGDARHPVQDLPPGSGTLQNPPSDDNERRLSAKKRKTEKIPIDKNGPTEIGASSVPPISAPPSGAGSPLNPDTVELSNPIQTPTVENDIHEAASTIFNSRKSLLKSNDNVRKKYDKNSVFDSKIKKREKPSLNSAHIKYDRASVSPSKSKKSLTSSLNYSDKKLLKKKHSQNKQLDANVIGDGDDSRGDGSDDESILKSASDSESEALDDDNRSEADIDCLCNKYTSGVLMIECEKCLRWQHAKCVGIKSAKKVPKDYICSRCIEFDRIIAEECQSDDDCYDSGDDFNDDLSLPLSE